MKAKILTSVALFAVVSLAANAQPSSMHQTYQPGNPAFTPPSHNVEWTRIALESPDEFYVTEEAKRIADNVLLYQRDIGGWQKNTGFHVELTQEQKDNLIANKGRTDDITIDNNAVYMEMYYLAKMYNATGIERYKDGFLKGLNYIFESQYENGGWPQIYPNKNRTNYSACVTFNDDATVNMLTILKGIAERDELYAFVDDPMLLERSKDGLKRGIDVILKTQIRLNNGVLTGWCAQYDEVTLEPAAARVFEPAGISGEEGAGIVMFLMSFDNPTPEMRQAIDAAVKWFDGAKITGIRVENFVGENGRPDRRVVPDPDAAPYWARFYDIETGEPFFAGRDSVKRATFAEIEQERRAGYNYYVRTPQEMLDLYQEYVKR
ncbi:MAG: pectate lyase [Bacteroidales bacterium]|nr:pectate lyase [Bacteroidales bacterium]